MSLSNESPLTARGKQELCSIEARLGYFSVTRLSVLVRTKLYRSIKKQCKQICLRMLFVILSQKKQQTQASVQSRSKRPKMADDEQFSLCWNNFNTNLSAGFHESLCRGDLVDVTLAAEGQLVKAHRLVLSVCSPYFRKMFTQMPANQHAFVFLKDVSASALKDLIQFMYCGEVNVKQEALPAFISTAEALQIKGLTESVRI